VLLRCLLLLLLLLLPPPLLLLLRLCHASFNSEKGPCAPPVCVRPHMFACFARFVCLLYAPRDG